MTQHETGENKMALFTETGLEQREDYNHTEQTGMEQHKWQLLEALMSRPSDYNDSDRAQVLATVAQIGAALQKGNTQTGEQ
jgi:hypothetical protein